MAALNKRLVANFAFAFAILTVWPLVALSATVTWKDPITGDWTDATKWDGGQVPGPNDDVVIEAVGSYTVALKVIAPVRSLTLGAGASTSTQVLSIASTGSLSSTAEISVNVGGDLQILGGTLSGSGPTNVAGILTWTNGTITGSGELTISGVLRIASPLGSVPTLDGRVLTNAGAATWSQGTSIILRNNAILANAGTFDIQADGAISLGDATVPKFKNSGVVSKSSGTGTTTIDVDFENVGTLNRNAGTLSFARTSSFGGAVTGSGALLFPTGTHACDGLAIGGSGTTRIAGATLIGTGAGLTVASESTLQLSSGTVAGAGPITVNGAFVWESGSIAGAGSLTVNGMFTLASSAITTPTLDGKSLTSTSVGKWISGASIVLRNNAVLTNTGTFDIQASGIFSPGDASTVQFVNSGTVTRSTGIGIATIDVDFVNTGTVERGSGTIALTRTSTLSGNVTGSANLVFSSGLHALDGVTFSGSGNARISGATVNTTGTGATVSPGSTLQLSSGALAGAGPLTINGVIVCEGGTIAGTGPLTVNGTLNVVGGPTLDGKTLTNAGAATLGISGRFVLRNNASVVNAGIFEVQEFGSISVGDASTPQFRNSGSILKTGTGTGSIDADIVTSGTVSVGAGTLRLTRGYMQTGGFTVLSGGNLFAGQSLNIESGVLLGSGTIDGSVSVGGEMRPGFSPGTLTVVQSYLQKTSSTLIIELAGLEPGSTYDQVRVNGPTVTLDGALVVQLSGGFMPQVGDSFTILTAPRGGVTGNFTSTQVPVVAGLLFQVAVSANAVTVNVVEGPTPIFSFTPSPTASPTRTRTPTFTQTASPSFTPRASATPTITSTPTVTITGTRPPSLTPTPTNTPGDCSGDCNGDSVITIDELVKAVGIALGSAPITDCAQVDNNGDGSVTIDELVRAVNGALSGC